MIFESKFKNTPILKKFKNFMHSRRCDDDSKNSSSNHDDVDQRTFPRRLETNFCATLMNIKATNCNEIKGSRRKHGLDRFCPSTSIAWEVSTVMAARAALIIHRVSRKHQEADGRISSDCAFNLHFRLWRAICIRVNLKNKFSQADWTSFQRAVFFDTTYWHIDCFTTDQHSQHLDCIIIKYILNCSHCSVTFFSSMWNDFKICLSVNL